MKTILIAAFASVTASAALTPANAQSGAPAPARSAEELYKAKCSHCHEKAGWGTRALAKRVDPAFAELLKRQALPAAYVKHVVRRGIGSMPQFTATDLTADELDRLAAWLEKRQ